MNSVALTNVSFFFFFISPGMLNIKQYMFTMKIYHILIILMMLNICNYVFIVNALFPFK